MTITEQVITISMVVLGTQFTRWIAFLVVPKNKPTPLYMQYLGRVLPSAIFAMLVIYSYKSLDLSSTGTGLAQIIAGLVVIVLQFWKKNMFLSIGFGTILYMVLIQIVF